jgi:hypothetical protein
MVDMLRVFWVERDPCFLLVFDKVGEIIKEAIAVECELSLNGFPTSQVSSHRNSFFERLHLL